MKSPPGSPVNRILLPLAMALLVAGCVSGDPSIPRRPVDIERVTQAQAPLRFVTLAAEVQFSIPVNSPLYRQIDVQLPGGRY
jgi:hypothetical protein